MKKSIIYLGILVIAFSSFTVRSNQFNDKFVISYKSLNSGIVNQEDSMTLVDNVNKVKSEIIYYKVENSTLLEINTILVTCNEKSIDDIIIEDNNIIENEIKKPEYLVYFSIINNTFVDISIDSIPYIPLNKSIDDVINEDKEMIENDLSE